MSGMNSRLTIFRTDLPSRAVSVYLCLLSHCNKQRQCYPSLSTIAFETKLSKKTVQRAIEDLCKEGFLFLEHRYRSNGGKSSSLYTLTDG